MERTVKMRHREGGGRGQCPSDRKKGAVLRDQMGQAAVARNSV